MVTGRYPSIKVRMDFRGAVAGDFFAVRCDVSDYGYCQQAVTAVQERLGPVDILVNNAGVTRDVTFRKMEKTNWDSVINTNLNGVFNSIHTFLPRIQSHGEGGAVIATSSLAGLLGHSGAGVYTASKFGVVGMMEALRFELFRTEAGVEPLVHLPLHDRQ